MKPRILLVEGGLEALLGLGESLEAAGFEVERAPDGFYTTLFLERQRPDAMLTAPRLPDMEALELLDLLDGDPALGPVKCILLPLATDPPPPSVVADRFDLVLPAGTPVERVGKLVRLAVEPPSVEARLPPSLSGTLEAVDFAQLTQLLGSTAQTGVLRIGLAAEGAGEGCVFFDRGLVIHCLWGSAEGRDAFRRMLAAAAVSPAAPFRFERLSTAEVFRLPKTLGASPQSLLLSTAVDLDEGSRPRPAARLGGAGG